MEQYYYDAFGKPYFFNASGYGIGYSPHGNRFLFTGREYLSALKLYDYRARMYQPELGRFMQPDPKHFAAGDYNLYRYCHNDPVNKSDPTGLQDEITNKSNTTMFGQGDWMRSGSAFTKGEALQNAKDYVRSINIAVDRAVKRANAQSPNVTWSASFANWLKGAETFKEPRNIATTEWSAKSTAVMNGSKVAGFNVNLQININWNESKSASFAQALRTDNMGGISGSRTGEIAHTRDAANALTSSYGGVPSACAIANEQAASMVGQSILADTASSRMDAALTAWADATMDHSRWVHDRPGDHWAY